MEKKHWIILVLCAIIIIGIVSIALRNPKTSPPNLENCNVLKYSGEGAQNVLFFSSKELAEENVEYFLNNSPYKENQNLFNFYYIDDYSPKCEIYQGIALLCYSKELIKKAGSCPHDYIVILEQPGTSIRSSAYMNVLSINSQHPLTTILHEFGHTFAGLDDEYVPATLAFNSKNCFSNCNKLGENCFEGCGKADYYRTIDSGLMRTLSSRTYGDFDNQIIISLLNKKKKTALTGNAILNSECANENYYLITGKYSESGISIQSQSLENGCYSDIAGVSNYNYSVNDDSGEVIANAEFNPALIFTDEPSNSNMIQGGALSNDGEFILTLPYTGKPLTLSINNETSQILKYRLEGQNLACRI